MSATWLGDVADRFLVDPSGYIEYIGETPINVSITGRATVEKVGGGSNQLEVRLALNWTAGDSGQVKTKGVTQNTTPTSVPIGGLYSLVSGDKIRPIFANNDGTSNILALVTSVEISE